MGFSVYVLYSEALDAFYIGSSENPEIRLRKHLSNHKGWTSKAKDWVICYVENYSTRQEALQRELQLKKWKSKLRIKELITKRT